MNVSTSRLSQFLCLVTIVVSSANTNLLFSGTAKLKGPNLCDLTFVREDLAPDGDIDEGYSHLCTMTLVCNNYCADVVIYSGITTQEEFIDKVQSKRKPAIIREIDLGECRKSWSTEYLINKVGHLDTKIHVSAESRMDFLNKNFLYKTLSMAETIKRASQDTQEDYFIQPEEFYYLRSLSSERRGREVSDIRKQFPQIASDVQIPSFFNPDDFFFFFSDIRKQFPQIASDVQIPSFFNPDDFFSSVLRVSSKGIQLWTHYDIMDNVLIQIQGRKRVVLFDPSDVNFLYMEGDKSRVIDIDNPDLETFPDFIKAKKYTCVMEPGDVLFIPALWFHNTLALSFGVAVNVFWKNLDHGLYDKKDFYGNKDLLPAAKALQNIDNAARLLSSLPEQYKDFYLKRCLRNIENHLNQSETDQKSTGDLSPD